jgi:hypothetical protein
MVILVALVLLPKMTSLPSRFALTMVLSVPQLYVLPVADFYLSLAFVSALALWPEVFKNWRSLLQNKVVVVAAAIMLTQAASLLWSSDPRLGIRTLAYAAPFFLIASAAASMARDHPRALRVVLRVVCAELLLLALLVVSFRLDPDFEMAYLRSELAGWLTGPNTIRAMLDGTGRNNIFDPAKSGGVFVNANIAAAYLGIGALTAFALAGQNQGRARWLLLVGVFLLAGVFFTGSKAGTLLGLILPLAAVGVALHARFDRLARNTILAVALILGPASLVLAWQVTMHASQLMVGDLASAGAAFVAESANTAGVRLQIWRHAATVFADTPFLGQGFGGWGRSYAPYANTVGLSPSFPPHNTLIYLWSQSGLLAVLLALAFIFLVARLAWVLIRSDQPQTQHLGLLLGLTSAWHFGHGMGENWGLWGDPHLLPLFATLVGWSIYARSAQPAEGLRGSPLPRPQQTAR